MREPSNAAAFPLPGILAIVFLVLKLTKTIDWSWWWVLSPLWITALVVLMMVIGIAVYEARR